MKTFIVALTLVTLAYTKTIPPQQPSVLGYLEKSIKLAEEIRIREEKILAQSRIVGGLPVGTGVYPWQAGLLIEIVGIEHGRGVCGGSLFTPNRVVTAAHCWRDGVNQGWRLEVVLGSAFLFEGGERIQTSDIVVHDDWTPLLVRNDIAVIRLAENVALSATIAPVSLPSGSEVEEDFVSSSAIASGFGLSSDNEEQVSGNLNQVSLEVISNSACSVAFPLIIQPSNICTSGLNGVGPCRGDSGGPLVVRRGNRNILIGVTSFGSALGCETIFPAAFARVTSFVDFLTANS